MEKMRTHKNNVERRMRVEAPHSSSRMFGGGGGCGAISCGGAIINGTSSIRQFPRQSLDPSWYTDNIYSNQSIDLDEDNYHIFNQNYRDINYNSNKDYDSQNYDDQMCEPAKFKTVNLVKTSNEYKYPKSTSCCFGISDYVPKHISAIPKSHSFSVGNDNSLYMKYSRINVKQPTRYDPFVLPRAPIAAGCNRAGCFNETHLSNEMLDTDSNKNDDDIDSRIDDWTDRIYDNNGNLSEYFTADEEVYDDESTHSFAAPDTFAYNHSPDHQIADNDMFLMKHDGMNYDDHGNLYGDLDPLAELHCDTRYVHHNLGQLIKNERTKLMMQNKMNKYRDSLVRCSAPNRRDKRDDYHSSLYNSALSLNKIKNKSSLEVKLPNKYDDSSPDSTDLELDDFNFDLNKYWENKFFLPSELDSANYLNNNCNNYYNNFTKIKNTNKYNNGGDGGSYNYNDRSCCSRSTRGKGMSKFLNNNHHTMLSPNSPPLPIRKFSKRKIYPEHYNNCYMCNQQAHMLPESPTPSPSPPPVPYHPQQSSSHSNAISLINNIFSIYKPNKYSPLNCHPQKIPQKLETNKKNNIQSTSRPITLHHKTDFLSSLKRPLLINPQYSSEHPRFKIIPDKTGLRISPLYKLEPEYTHDLHGGHLEKNAYRYKLKSTSRPLLFRH